uniref:Uncharacterized protein n=1 Tax=Hyaloperonospora arabidopsidis (strain Emoy2) TaxID=559515 RepID=M4BZ66_HYAAE
MERRDTCPIIVRGLTHGLPLFLLRAFNHIDTLNESFLSVRLLLIYFMHWTSCSVGI